MALDNFIRYMEAKQKERPASTVAPAASGGTAFSLLAAFADEPDGAIALPDLQRAAGMSFLDFSQAVKRLEESGFLTLSGEPGQETARLTRVGKDVALLARPA
jgi:hypothetical protein